MDWKSLGTSNLIKEIQNSMLTSFLAELGLNIQEAHAFSTNDGYSLDVFVVEGWSYEKDAWSKPHSWSPKIGSAQAEEKPLPEHVQIPTDGTDLWEIDFRLQKFENKVASESYGDLYRGTYCSQDVAIKVLKFERVIEDMQREFAQEVYIMRDKLNNEVESLREEQRFLTDDLSDIHMRAIP